MAVNLGEVPESDRLQVWCHVPAPLSPHPRRRLTLSRRGRYDERGGQSCWDPGWHRRLRTRRAAADGWVGGSGVSRRRAGVAPGRRKSVGSTSVQITINGQNREVPGPLTVAELLRHLGVKPGYVAVEVNQTLVARSRQAETPIAAGDVLEIVTLVGGGAGATVEGEPLTIGTHV